MRLLYGLPLITSLFALPAVAEAQEPTSATIRVEVGSANRAPRQPRSLRPGVALIEQKDSLGLTAEQVEKIEKIAAELQEKNKPLYDKLLEARASTARGQRSPAEMDELREKMRPIMEEMRNNIVAARDEILKVLEPKQQARARKLWEDSEQQGQRRGARRGQ